jgi:hypothetical protein
MAETPGEAVMRRSSFERAGAFFMLVVWCALLVLHVAFAFTDRSITTTAAVLGLIFLVFGASVLFRTYRMSVRLGPAELVVRNRFRTRRIQRDDIAGFRVAPVRLQPFLRSVRVVLRDGRIVPLEVSERTSLLRRERESLAQDLDTLQRWEPRATAP